MNPALAGKLYFGLQAIRSGVTDAMVRNASNLLDGSLDWRAHVIERLSIQYPTGSDPLKWLEEQPLVDRTFLIGRYSTLDRSGRRVEQRKTSGSSGTPFQFLKDREMTAQMDAAMWAAYQWHGIYPGDRQARFWGLPIGRIASTQRRFTDLLQNRRRLSAFDVSQAGCLEYFHDLIRFRPKYVYGYPSLVHEFVQHCRAVGYDGRDLRVGVVICTGELLAPLVRDEIAAYFGARVVNEYGCTESGIVSLTCEAGSEHILPVAVYPELVSNSGVSVEPGSTGQVVVTDLYGGFAPMVRYKLNDLAVLARDNGCGCGRLLPHLEVQRGRVDGFVQTPSGKRIYDAILAYTVPSGILRFCVRQLRSDLLHAQIVAGVGFDKEVTPASCKSIWEQAFGPGMNVTIEVVDDIPLQTSGKSRYFIPLEDRSEAKDGLFL